MAKKNTNLSNFESDLKKLQDILEDIESDKLSLEESIEKYKEGVELSKKCQNVAGQLLAKCVSTRFCFGGLVKSYDFKPRSSWPLAQPPRKRFPSCEQVGR